MTDWLMAIGDWLAQTELARYLVTGGWLAWLQLALLVLIFQRFLFHALRRWLARASDAGRWHDGYLEALVQACFALGLLLTFSGLYGYLAEGDMGSQGNLLKALGSSAIGYSAAVLGALAGLLDVLATGWVSHPSLVEQQAAARAPVRGRSSVDQSAVYSSGFHPCGSYPESLHDVFPIAVDVAGGGGRPVGRAVDDPGSTDFDSDDSYGGGRPRSAGSGHAAGIPTGGAVDYGDVAWDRQPPGAQLHGGADDEDLV